MYGFWQRLLGFLGLWLNWNATTQFDTTDGILSQDLEVWMDDVRERWGIQGMSVAIVTSPDYKYGSGAWQEEVLSFWSADGRSKALIESNITLADGELLSWETRLETIFPGWTDPPPWAVGDDIDICNITIADLGSASFSMHDTDIQFRFVWRIVRDLISGDSYAEALKRTVLSDLGLDFTISTSLNASQRDHRVDGFIRQGVDVLKCAEDIAKDHSIAHKSCLGDTRNVGWWTEHFRDWSIEDDEWFAGAGGLVMSSKDLVSVWRYLNTDWKPKLLRGVLDKDSELYRLVFLDPSYAMCREFATRGGVGSGFGVYYPWYEEQPIIDHLGSWGGQSSMMTWMPENGFGVFAVINDQYYGKDFLEMLSWTIKDHLLHSDRKWDKDWSYESAQINGLGWQASRYLQPPLDPSPPLNRIEGTLIHDTFGRMLVREISGRNGAAPKSADEDAIMRAVSTQTGIPLNFSGPIFITDYRGKIVADRLLFTHWNADHSNWTAIKQYKANDRGDGAVKYQDQKWVVEILGTGAAEVEDKGIKIHNGWWSACGIQIITHPNGSCDLPGSDSHAFRLTGPQHGLFENRMGVGFYDALPAGENAES